MKTRSIVKGIAQAVAMAFFAASAALAQQGGQAAPKAGDPARQPANGASPKVAATDARAGSSPSVEAPTVARLMSVEGNVLVSNATGLAAGNKGQALLKGSRVITATNSKAAVQYDDGCWVTMGPNERLVITSDESCKKGAVVAQTMLPEPPIAPATQIEGRLASAALSGTLDGSIGGLAVGVLGVTAAVRMRRDETVSPN